MTIYCDEKDRYENTTSIDGVDYWTAQQFADLTTRQVPSIRMLLANGNRVRKLQGKVINHRAYVLATELFDFPFVVRGRPDSMGDFIEKFYLDNDVLLREESVLKRDPVEPVDPPVISEEA